MVQYGAGYNFADSLELKLTALELMFSDKVDLWEQVGRGIDPTRPAAAKLTYMVEKLKAIVLRREAEPFATQ